MNDAAQRSWLLAPIVGSIVTERRTLAMSASAVAKTEPRALTFRSASRGSFGRRFTRTSVRPLAEPATQAGGNAFESLR